MDNSTVIIPEEAKKGKIHNLATFSFLHFLNDIHSNALPTIVPMLTNSIGITLGQAGLMNAFFGIAHIIGQPVSGYFADRTEKPSIALSGVVLCTAGACLLPLSPSFAFAVLLVVMLSAGTAMFHPQSFGITGRSGGDRNLAFFISMFSAFGSFGAAVGPIYIVYMISKIGKKGLPFTLIPIFALCLYAWLSFKPESGRKIKRGANTMSEFLGTMKTTINEIKDIVAIASLRDSATQGIKLFLPMLIIGRGGSVAAGGAYLFAVTASATLAGIVAGKTADTIGYKKVLIGALSISPFFLIAGLRATGTLSLILLMAGFAFIQASMPVTTAMSQSRCPAARSTASSISMGVSWGIANFMTYPVGLLADAVGLQPTMYIVAASPWLITAYEFAAAGLFKGKKR